MIEKNCLLTVFLRGISIVAFFFSTSSSTADVVIGCVSEKLSSEFSAMVSVSDLTESSASAHLIIELPVRFSNLELEYIHLRRLRKGKRVLWVGIPFDELNENRSWSTVEILRSELKEYHLFAQYHTNKTARDDCSYEFPIVWEQKK